MHPVPDLDVYAVHLPVRHGIYAHREGLASARWIGYASRYLRLRIELLNLGKGACLDDLHGSVAFGRFASGTTSPYSADLCFGYSMARTLGW